MIKKLIHKAALLALLVSPMPALAQDSIYDEDFAAKARAWLLDNPEIMLEVVQLLERNEAQQASVADKERIAANIDALFNDGRDGIIGGGSIVAVEFFDYQCGYCKRQAASVKAFAQSSPNHKVILKEFPILGPVSEVAARAALAAKMLNGSDAYLRVHNGLLDHQGRLDDGVIDGILSSAGLNPADVRVMMQDPAITGQINDTRALAARLGINGTPGFVFKDSIARGLLSQQDIEAGAK